MTRGELLNLLVENAKEYCPIALDSVIQNKKMYSLDGSETCSQKLVDAIVVNFINFVAAGQCINYGLKTEELYKE